MPFPFQSASDKGPFRPLRAASWWSVAEDLLWPEKKVRDKICRRADALAAAHVDTVIQFGFHCRFDFAWYFGAIHGYFAEIAAALHEREIRFLDHYSCNVVARPRSAEERVKYHSFQRHHVDLYPDAVAAETAGYAGYRFNDLREIDLVTGGPAYTDIYQAEMFCHNNPSFLAMHEAYLKRQLAEIPLDGLQQDDMAFYNFFRSCGCRHCRERFRREYGHDVPPMADQRFWGDTSRNPRYWGNYDNPVFRDWVDMRYRVVSEHLAMVKRVLGPDRPLMTCCSSSGPQLLNSLALSYERFIEVCDWVMLENCGLACNTIEWARMEPEAVLHKSIGFAKAKTPAPAIACSYAVYDDGAYLGWALARFWGVINWVSTLRHGLEDNPEDKEETALIGSLNAWECRHDAGEAGTDVIEVAVAFLGANKENGIFSEDGKEYWDRGKSWSLALLERNIGYRFAASREFSDLSCLADTGVPLILDSCACVSDREFEGIEAFLAQGGQAWVVPPFGTRDERGNLRSRALWAEAPARVRMLDTAAPAALLDGLIRDQALVPRVVSTGPDCHWKIRLRRTPGGLAIHLLNQGLAGVPHPTDMDRWGHGGVLQHLRSPVSARPVSFTLDTTDLTMSEPLTFRLYSPEREAPSRVDIDTVGPNLFRLGIDMTGIRLYALAVTR